MTKTENLQVSIDSVGDINEQMSDFSQYLMI